MKTWAMRATLHVLETRDLPLYVAALSFCERWSKSEPSADPISEPGDGSAINASWLDQIAIWFSLLQRKLLQPNHFGSLDELRASDPRFHHSLQ